MDFITALDVMTGVVLAAGVVLVAYAYPFLRNDPDNVKEPTMRASITTLTNGRFGLVTPEGIVSTYARRRDAVRGAKRAGLALVG